MTTTIILWLINFFIILLTTIFIALWFYLLCNRKLYNIELSTNIISDNYYYFSCLLLSTVLLLILALTTLIISFYLNKSTNKINESEIFFKIREKFIEYIKNFNIFFKAYSMIVTYFGTGSFYLMSLSALAKKIQSYSYTRVALIIKICVLFPRMFICLIFIAEISFGKLYYYYYSLFLLTFYLFFRLTIFVFRDLAERMLPEAEKLIDFDVVKETFKVPNGDEFCGIRLRMTAEYSDVNLDYFMYTYYYPLLHLNSYIEFNIRPIYFKYLQCSRIIYYLIHVIGLIYILFYLT